MEEEKPTAAFVLPAIGGICILIGGVGYVALGGMCGNLVGMFKSDAHSVGRLGTMIYLCMTVGVISSILVIFGVTMINKALRACSNSPLLVHVYLFHIILVTQKVLSTGERIKGLLFSPSDTFDNSKGLPMNSQVKKEK